ncbi:hypothetical protein JZ785_14465 [Alicyclobacillus curvatus]|nr:hypothetical protein JZ785_14465 [Alicyclobacillus curvatus]
MLTNNTKNAGRWETSPAFLHSRPFAADIISLLPAEHHRAASMGTIDGNHRRAH